MKLERNQLNQVRQACQEEKRALDQTVVRMDELRRSIRGSMTFIRNEVRRRLAQAKALMATQERQYRDAMLKLQRLEMEGAKRQSGDAAAEAMVEDRQMEAQRQLVEECAQEVTRGCDHYLQAEREVQEIEKRLIQQEKAVEQAISAARHREEEAFRELKSLGQVLDKADKLLADYERPRDD